MEPLLWLSFAFIRTHPRSGGLECSTWNVLNFLNRLWLNQRNAGVLRFRLRMTNLKGDGWVAVRRLLKCGWGGGSRRRLRL